MKGNKSFFTGLLIFASVVCYSWVLGRQIFNTRNDYSSGTETITDTDFGMFLAAQHALYINDFTNASQMISAVKSDVPLVKQTKTISNFFGGKMSPDTSGLEKSKDLISRFVYDAHLIDQDKWKDVYERHNQDESLIAAPIRIFSAVKQGKTKEAIKFVNSLKTDDSWKAFVRGQIAVLNNDIDGAAKEFAKVHPDFMNVNDYLYLMSFYQKNEMFEDMDILRDDFVNKPGSMYILNYPDIPDWSNYDGYKNNLVFGIIQTISHTQIMLYTDLSLIFLRFAQMISNDTNLDAINYYLGQYYFYNSGDYKTCFQNINKSSPLYLFGVLKTAEKDQDFKEITKIAKQNPLFIPAVNMVVRENIKNGNKRAALRFINRGLGHKNLNDNGRAYFLKQRTHVNLMFNNPDAAQHDIDEIRASGSNLTADIMLLQARTWEKQNKNLDNAYNLAMELIKKNTSDFNAWDVLGLIISKREGIDNALEIMEGVGSAAITASSIFEHLGDLYLQKGDKTKAKRSYLHALDLSEDGLIIVPSVRKKLKKIK
jgi:predicted negative regulator of RcsB-dependent stress response